MNFPPRSLPDLAPADLPELGFLHTGYHHPLVQQALRVYGVDGVITFTQQAQLPDGHFANTQNHGPYPFSLSTVLPSYAQHGAEFAGNARSEPGFAASAASAGPEGPASPMGPPARPRKRKAPTLRADE